MKPSKFIVTNLKWLYSGYIGKKVIDYEKLDKRFIDKKELKNKIQTKMMGYGLDFDRSDIKPKYKQHSRERYNELEQVLELLEE